MEKLKIMFLFVRYSVVLFAVDISIQVYDPHTRKSVEKDIFILINGIFQIKKKYFLFLSTQEGFIFLFLL